mmetsp:Transcript_37246/g.84111  ORF Transcript_37246/g.84111 Transcript_37246/m.84111 type:complete len:212 (-) Transcript_37246:17-652(-)
MSWRIGQLSRRRSGWAVAGRGVFSTEWAGTGLADIGRRDPSTSSPPAMAERSDRPEPARSPRVQTVEGSEGEADLRLSPRTPEPRPKDGRLRSAANAVPDCLKASCSVSSCSSALVISSTCCSTSASMRTESRSASERATSSCRTMSSRSKRKLRTSAILLSNAPIRRSRSATAAKTGSEVTSSLGATAGCRGRHMASVSDSLESSAWTCA